MIHWRPLIPEDLCSINVWGLRCIPSGIWGDKYDWSIVVVGSLTDKTPIATLEMGHRTGGIKFWRDISDALYWKGFVYAKIERPDPHMIGITSWRVFETKPRKGKTRDP